MVIVDFNAGPMLARAVAALHRQTFRDFRVIIIDNASTDRSPDNLPDGPVDIIVVRAPRNLGFAAGNNLAIRDHVRAEWLALLNPDAFPRPEWLEQLVEAARRRPDYACWASKLVDANDPVRLDGAGDVYHVSGLYWRDGHGCIDGGKDDGEREIFSPCAAAALYRTRDVKEAGAFDEDFFCYGEDVDLAFRLRLYGHRCLYVPASVVDHVGSGSAGARSAFQIYHGHRNMPWVYVKNMPGWLFWLYLPYHFLLNVVSLVVFTARGHGATIARAKRDALLGLPRAWSKRREIQRRRVARASDVRRMMRRGWIDKSCDGRPARAE